MQVALYEPDIAQNTGTILRLCACLGVAAHIIEPAGFPVSDRAFRRAGMDYLEQVTLRRHASWAAFDTWRRAEKLRLEVVYPRGMASSFDHPLCNPVPLVGCASSCDPGTARVAAATRMATPIRAGVG